VHVSADVGVRVVTLAHTPLHALHAELGARFTAFAGFEMPLQYGEGLKAEHLWTRAHAGLFDVSHMGQVRVTGPGLHSALERALPVDFEGWPAGLQRYTLLLSDAGGIVDDLMALRLADELRLVVNAAGRERDLERLRALCPALAFELSGDALLALQGPAAEEVLRWLAPGTAQLAFMHAGWFDLDGARALVTRSGYTGEDGFEIAVSREQAEGLARRLLAHPDVKPVGLGARDTLRLEAALPLHGQDIDADTSPAESGLGWAIARSRRAGGGRAGGFPGAARVLRELEGGPPRRLVGFVGVEGVPIRAGAVIVDESGAELGVVTSGTMSPTLARPIGLARISSDAPPPSGAMVRGQRRAIRESPLPFVPKHFRRRAVGA
jgi:aminomethyltransferase